MASNFQYFQIKQAKTDYSLPGSVWAIPKIEYSKCSIIILLGYEHLFYFGTFIKGDYNIYRVNMNQWYIYGGGAIFEELINLINPLW